MQEIKNILVDAIKKVEETNINISEVKELSEREVKMLVTEIWFLIQELVEKISSKWQL